jgi:hypothetical protein
MFVKDSDLFNEMDDLIIYFKTRKTHKTRRTHLEQFLEHLFEYLEILGRLNKGRTVYLYFPGS